MYRLRETCGGVYLGVVGLVVGLEGLLRSHTRQIRAVYSCEPALASAQGRGGALRRCVRRRAFRGAGVAGGGVWYCLYAQARCRLRSY